MKKIISILAVMLIVMSCFAVKSNQKTLFADNSLDFDCKAYVLMDYNSGKILESNKKSEKLQVASMVKLMTSLLTMEKIENGEWSLDTKLMTSQYAASMEGSQAFLDAGHEYTVDELLKSIIVASANDSCVVIAENYSGSEQNFVQKMNKKAKELGMNNTLYENSTGLPSANEYSCAEDIAIILKEVCKHDLYHKYATIWMDTLTHESGRKTELVNTNRLIRYYQGCDCGETGFTDEAGYCLSASAVKNGFRLVSVVIGCKSSQARFEISSSLLNYGFANYESKQIINKDDIVVYNKKINGIKDVPQFVCERDYFYVCKRNLDTKLTQKIEFNDKIKLPLKQGDIVGKTYIVDDGIVIDEINIICKQDYKKQGFINYVQDIIDAWSI